MRILVDTHYLLWSFIDTLKISEKNYDRLLSEANEVFYSQASLWEISIKYNLGKLLLRGLKPEEFYEELCGSYFKCRPLENEELISFHRLPIEHRDPFDRIMIWQAIRSDYHFLSADSEIGNYKKYGLKVLT
jgi:PIN domain nuclease of toxin-antitoxin system